MNQDSNSLNEAKVLLKHYFNLCFHNATGKDLDSEHYAEIEQVVDLIVVGIAQKLEKKNDI